MAKRKNEDKAVIAVLISLGILAMGMLTLGLMLASGRH